MSKRKAVQIRGPETPGLSMRGVMHTIESANSMANDIAGLAKPLEKLDAAKIDNEDGTLAWYTGTGGFHSMGP